MIQQILKIMGIKPLSDKPKLIIYSWRRLSQKIMESNTSSCQESKPRICSNSKEPIPSKLEPS